MPTSDRLAVDVVGDELAGIFGRSARELELIVNDALRRGLDPSRAHTPAARRGDATAAYRARQLTRARAILADLERQSKARTARAVIVAYRSTLRGIDATLGVGGNLSTGFGSTHVRAVTVLAANTQRSLNAAIQQTAGNVADVFARADAIEGPLLNGQSPAGARHFIGRRQDDPYRREGLEAVAQGIAKLDTRPQVAAHLTRRLIDNGVTDALTGFVDRAGRRWSLETYAAMVARTTTREAMTAATVNRMAEHEVDLVTISEHSHASDECDPYDGQTFSLNGATPGYDVLDVLPPFHPNCAHVMTPGEGNLDAFERELEAAVGQELAEAAPTPAPPRPSPEKAAPAPNPAPAPPNLSPANTPPASPFSPAARPRYGPDTAEHLEDQRAIERMVNGDPGPDPDASAARARDFDRDTLRAVKALNRQIGPAGVNYLKRKDSVRRDLRGAMLRGEFTTRELIDEMEDDYIAREGRRLERERLAERRRRYNTRPVNCPTCGSFKPKPASICDRCGDDPLDFQLHDSSGYNDRGELEDNTQLSARRAKFNLEHGYAPD